MPGTLETKVPSKIIALDYDGTYTADPELWLHFVKQARARGHTVFCITMRYPHEQESMCANLTAAINGVICTSRLAKKKYVEALGIPVDIWIDDRPEWLFENSI